MKKNKTILRLSLLLLILSTFSFLTKASAQSQETNVYGFGYSYNYNTKTLYVSNIVSGVINSEVYVDAMTINLKNQWNDKMKVITKDYYTYNSTANGFASDRDVYDKIYKERTKLIGKYKAEDFSIINVTDFYFAKEKKNE
ncbi:hypothetical protein [Rhizosphaericola mali]|uniref:Uncharacterized protein n=1 Tax=Rhizosphaericola mali TaxID=2545455 RepID=A0A5P2G6V4_9BACT|nr:hypothetical protein [Rhizosphaericola mali]QES89510.1 hypothetical protein E0W69_012845 [Rhizosphaericola mali]